MNCEIYIHVCGRCRLNFMFVLFNPLGLECFANFITHKVTRKVFFAHIYIIKSVNVIQYEKKNHQIIDIIFQFVACIIRNIEVAKEMYCMIFSQSSQPRIKSHAKCVSLCNKSIF